MHKKIITYVNNFCMKLIQDNECLNLTFLEEELVDHFELEHDEVADIHSNSSLGISEEDLFLNVFKHIQKKFGSLLDD